MLRKKVFQKESPDIKKRASIECYLIEKRQAMHFDGVFLACIIEVL